MNRPPPAAIRRQLRHEVGFGCPVPECGNPYLAYHHFDPPWRAREHHEPAGMIALCAEHHNKADAGAFTVEQLRQYKIEGGQRNQAVRGRFDWMRRELLIVLGGNFCLGSRHILAFGEQPVIWVDRDPDGYLLLNIDMLTLSREQRIRLEDNSWICQGKPVDLESPPSGRVLSCEYANGDILKVEFVPLDSAEAMIAHYPDSQPTNWKVSFPITAVNVSANIGDSDLSFSPKGIKTPPDVTIVGGYMAGCEPAFLISPNRGGFGFRLPWSPELSQLRRSSINELDLQWFSDRVFENQTIVIDDCAFERCTFKNCIIIYKGGDYRLFFNHFEAPQWVFADAADATVSMIADLYKWGAKDFVDALVNRMHGLA